MSRDMVFEDVPKLDRRTGDTVVANQNNATILFGRDRAGSVNSGHGDEKGAGAITAVVGRKGSDPVVADDRATVYLSSKSDPDAIASTQGFGQTQTAVSAIVARADCVRIVPRTDLKISVGSAYILMDSSGKITVEGNVSLGEGASNRILRGEPFSQWASTHTHPSSVGPTGVPIQPIPDSVYSPTNKVD